MSVRRGWFGAHRFLGLCTLVLLLACAVTGITASPAAAASVTATVSAQSAHASTGDESPKCGGGTQEQSPAAVPRQHQEQGQPVAGLPTAPDTVGVPPTAKAHSPAPGPDTRPPDLAQLSILRI